MTRLKRVHLHLGLCTKGNSAWLWPGCCDAAVAGLPFLLESSGRLRQSTGENAVSFSNRKGGADAGPDLGPVVLAQVADHRQFRAMNRQHVGSEARHGAEPGRLPVQENLVR